MDFDKTPEPNDAETIVRRLPVRDPLTLSARLGHGPLTVVTADDLDELVVELVPSSTEAADLARRITVELSGATLTVARPHGGGLAEKLAAWRPDASAQLATTVTVPSGTVLRLATISGAVTVRGRSGRADVATGSGEVRLDEIDGDLTLRYGTSSASVSHVHGSVTARAGGGELHFGTIDGGLEAGCGGGRLDVNEVHGPTRLRAGAGEARLGAVYGDVDLASGAGTVRVGLPAGVSAQLDATTGFGRVHSELPVEDAPTPGRSTIRVRARTGRGDIHLFRASAPAA